MGDYPGIGPRIEAKLRERGYVKNGGELDVQRFCWDHRFEKTNVYNWLSERYTPFKDLIRLCVALDCSAEWLLTGAERGKAAPRQGRARKLKNLLVVLSLGAGAAVVGPTARGSAEAQPLWVPVALNIVPLIGSGMRRVWHDRWRGRCHLKWMAYAKLYCPAH